MTHLVVFVVGDFDLLRDFARQIGRTNPVVLSEGASTLDCVLQLGNVAGPLVLIEEILSVFIDRLLVGR